MLTDWIIHTKLYDNLKKEKSLDNAKLNNIIEKVINFPFNCCLNDLIIDEKIEILFENPKVCMIFESIEFNEDKIASIRDKFIDFAIKKDFEFSDSYKNENGEMYNFYENMRKITCFERKYKCKNCEIAARDGHLGCLKYLHENGCYWDFLTCASAAANGHLKCLKYAHENGCLWFCATTLSAASNGHLECLRYAHENGCPWNLDACLVAAEKYGQLECLKYARENGCPGCLE